MASLAPYSITLGATDYPVKYSGLLSYIEPYLTNLETFTFSAGNVSLAGNLGLGVTPGSWTSGSKAMQFSSLGMVWQQTNGDFNIGYNTVETTANAFVYKLSSIAATRFSASDSFKWYTAPSGTAGNAISFTQAMTLDTDGELGVGITSPTARLHAYSGTAMKQLTVDGTGAIKTGVNFANGGTTYGQIYFDNNAPYDMSVVQQYTTGSLIFGTNSTERARITSGGYFKASNTGTYVSSTSSYHEFNGDATICLLGYGRKASAGGVVINADTLTANAYTYLYKGANGGTDTFLVAANGNVTNTNGSYGTISDARMKTDIVDTGSQWADIKAVRFRKFKMKDDPSGLVQLGVVAQELEQTSPGLVLEQPDLDADGNPTSTTTKSVKTSVLLMKAAVALQEAMARIEQLESRVAALEAQP